jgi:dolichyl-phosphate beta-glucosyltransferase
MTAPDLSIVLPAYNEEELIASTLDGLYQYLSTRPESYEIIVADDGSTDATTDLVLEWKGRTGANLRLLLSSQNRGKGSAIRRGALESQGRYVIFLDSDLPYELDAIDELLQSLHNGFDLAVGSRVLPGASVKGVPTLRYVAGQIFSWLVQAVLFRGLPDTQCGFKSFKAEAAREIFKRLTIDGFGFDVEMLFVARKLGYKIRPVAVRMTDNRRESRVRIFSDSLRMFGDLFVVRWNDLQGKYK